jgi:hypothetical protein
MAPKTKGARAPRIPPGKPRKQPYAEVWICSLCEAHPEFDTRADFVEHVHEAHPDALNAEGKLSARSTLIQALDAQEWYSNFYRWAVPDGRELAQQSAGGPRETDDPMRWG